DLLENSYYFEQVLTPCSRVRFLGIGIRMSLRSYECFTDQLTSTSRPPLGLLWQSGLHLRLVCITLFVIQACLPVLLPYTPKNAPFFNLVCRRRFSCLLCRQSPQWLRWLLRFRERCLPRP